MLRIWKGVQVISESTKLMGPPVTILNFYMDQSIPCVPSIAVCIGPYIYVYKYQSGGTGLRPQCKFTLPAIEIDPAEQQVWDEVRGGRIDAETAFQRLTELRERGVSLTHRSLELVLTAEPDMRRKYVSERAQQPLICTSSITCLASVKRTIDSETEPSHLIVGTEAGYVYILDSSSSKMLNKIKLDSVPTDISCEGIYSVEYRIAVACRNGRVYLVRDGRMLNSCVDPEIPVSNVLIQNKKIYCACMNNSLHCFSVKGRRLFSTTMPSPITAIEPMVLAKTRRFTGLIVGLQSGEIRVYSDTSLVNTYHGEEVVGLRFGTFGREEGALITTHSSGGIRALLLPRQVSLEAQGQQGPPPEQDIPLTIPRKSQLYIEQSTREIESCIDMHRIFQRDLCKLHLETARSFVRLLQDGQGPLAGVLSATLQLTAQVQGLGPHFKVKLSVENMSKLPVYHVPLLVQYNPEVYEVEDPVRQIPLLLPGLVHTVEVSMRCVDPQGSSDSISVHLCAANSSIPVLSAIVQMPLCEILDPSAVQPAPVPVALQAESG